MAGFTTSQIRERAQHLFSEGIIRHGAIVSKILEESPETKRTTASTQVSYMLKSLRLIELPKSHNKASTKKIRELATLHFNSGIHRNSDILTKILAEWPETPENTLRTQISQAIQEIKKVSNQSRMNTNDHKIDPSYSQLIGEQLKQYIEEVNQSNMSENTKWTYIRHATTFVRWLNHDFKPGVNVQ